MVVVVVVVRLGSAAGEVEVVVVDVRQENVKVELGLRVVWVVVDDGSGGGSWSSVWRGQTWTCRTGPGGTNSGVEAITCALLVQADGCRLRKEAQEAG